MPLTPVSVPLQQPLLSSVLTEPRCPHIVCPCLDPSLCPMANCYSACAAGCLITYAIWPEEFIFIGIFLCLNKCENLLSFIALAENWNRKYTSIACLLHSTTDTLWERKSLGCQTCLQPPMSPAHLDIYPHIRTLRAHITITSLWTRSNRFVCSSRFKFDLNWANI